MARARGGREAVVALALGFALGAAAMAAAAPAAKPPARGEKAAAAREQGQKPRNFAPTVLPDSVPDDLHAAWALRQRVGSAYWPEWARATPAPIVLRGNPFDFFINHPSPPSTSTAPKPIPGGGGTFETSSIRLQYTGPIWQRLETMGEVTCVPYDVSEGRPGSRADIAAMLAYRDFLAYESAAFKPVWATPADTGKVRVLRQNPDLLGWLNQEGQAMRQAVAATDPAERQKWAAKALEAAQKSEETAAKDPEAVKALAWLREARRYEGAAQFLLVILRSEAPAVVAGDTSGALPAADAALATRHAIWQARASSISDRTVTGAHLGAIAEVGALYCVLLDAWSPGWRSHIFDPQFQPREALAEALRTAGNRGAAKG